MIRKMGPYVFGGVFGLLLFFLILLYPIHAGQGLTWADLEADIQTITKGDLSWSDSVWMQIGNMGIQLISSWADCSIDTISVDIASGTAEYDLPVSCEKLWAVVNQGTYAVYEKMALADRGLAGTGLDDDVLKVYSYGSSRAKVGKVLGFYPIPQTADSALVYFFKDPDVIDAAADTVDVIEFYHPAVLCACLIYTHERLGGAAGKAKANRQWSLLPTLINNAKLRMESTPPDIIISPRIIGRAGQ